MLVDVCVLDTVPDCTEFESAGCCATVWGLGLSKKGLKTVGEEHLDLRLRVE